MTSTLNEISIGDIVKPANEGGFVYIYDIGHDLDGSVKNYLTYRVVDENDTISGTNALSLTKEGIISGNLAKLGLGNPVVEIRSNRLRTISATDDTYYVQDIAAKTSSNFQGIVENIHHDIGAHDQKYGQNDVRIRGMNLDNYTGGAVAGEARHADIIEKDQGLIVRRAKKASALVNIKDIYLDHAAEYGLISKETLTALGKNYNTLQQALTALKDGNLSVDTSENKPYEKAVKFTKAFPNAAKYVKKNERIWPESEGREEEVTHDPVVQQADRQRITIVEATEKGWISEETESILTSQPDDADCRSCIYLEEAFRLVGAHQHFVSEYVDPQSSEKISRVAEKQIIDDIKNAYNELSKQIVQANEIGPSISLNEIEQDLKTARSAFFEREDIKPSTFVHHDFTRAVVKRLEDTVKSQEQAISQRDYAALGITPPNQG